MTKTWMLYGANGYTGKLIAEEAAKRGMKPMLAGRTEEKIRPLAEKLDLSYRVFDLNELKTDLSSLENISLVLLCAGPFSQTSQALVSACLKLGIHYLDITGEIEVLESVLNKSADAKAAGSVMIPGVGFDVVPSDCLAMMLAKKLPSATSLELAFAGSAKLSPGTMKTMVENLPSGGRIRKDGRLTAVPTAYRTREVSFPFGKIFVSSIPWGDVCTAFYSTKIPNVIVYAPMPKAMARLSKLIGWLSPLLARTEVQNFLKQQIEKRVHGPTPLEQKTARMHVWGCVSDGKSEATGYLEIPEGYYFTMLSALRCVEIVLSGKVAPGSYTPSLAFGGEFITTFENVKLSFGAAGFDSP